MLSDAEKETLSQYGRALDVAGVVFLAGCSNSGAILHLNRKATDLLKISLKEENSSLLFSEYLELLQHELEDVTTEIAREGDTFHGRALVKSGSEQLVLGATVAPFPLIENNDSEHSIFQVILDDRNKFQRLEQEIRETQDFLQDLIRSSNLAIIAYDADLKAHSWNTQAEKVLGLPPALAGAKQQSEAEAITLPEDIHTLAKRLTSNEMSQSEHDEQLASLSVPVVHERQNTSSESLFLESHFAPIFSESGEMTGLVEYARDVTQRLKLEREAAYLRELNRQIVDNIPFGVGIIDQANQLKFFNKAADRMIDPDTDVELPADAAQLLPTKQALEQLAQITADVLTQHAAAADHQFDFQHAGQRRIIRHTGIPLWEEDLSTPSVLWILEDISEKEALQIQLIQSEKLAALGQLAAGIAHEIRSPLSAIFNALYDLNDLVDRDNEEIAEDIDIAMEEIQRVQSIINNLLDFARAGDDSLDEANVNDVIERTAKLLAKNLEDHRVQLVLDLTEDEARVAFGRNAMKQVLLNLMTNAMQAMPEGGALTISTEQSEPGAEVKLRVTDTGEGIAPEHLSNIFTPFFTTKEPGSGTGLGLSVVHSTLRDRGADIEVDSTVGEGTCFTITLPSAPK